jgi:hypothetical protein
MSEQIHSSAMSVIGGIAGIRCLLPVLQGPHLRVPDGHGEWATADDAALPASQAFMIATVRCERGFCRQADTGCVSSVTDTRAAVRHG